MTRAINARQTALLHSFKESGVQHRDGGAALLASGGKDRAVRLWDAATGACLAASAGHAGAVAALAFARRSGAFLVSGGVDRLLKVS